MAITTPNQIMIASTGVPGGNISGSIFSATGARIGITMKAISKKSMKQPRMNTRTFTTIRKPKAPPGMSSKRCSTQMWPSAALKVKEKTVEPIRMNSTKVDKRAVLSMAWRRSGKSRRLRIKAMISAPRAPMAPPSVGVATPRKMVPSTRKIRISGGMSTKVTCCAKRDSRPMPVTLLTTASVNATSEATVSDMITTSSPLAAMVRPVQLFIMPSCTCAQPQPAAAHSATSATSDTWPDAPLSSR